MKYVVAEQNMAGKKVVITGGNNGIGFHTAKALYAQGAHVTLACRSLKRAEEAAASISKRVSNAGGTVDVSELDLMSLESVRLFANRVLDRGEPVDVLINNAGIMACPYALSKDGLESQFQTNYLSHFLLTQMLLPIVSASTDPRIISVSSSAHNAPPAATGEGDLEATARPRQEQYGKWVSYCRSKLFQVMHAIELRDRLATSSAAPVRIATLHPGVVATSLGKDVLPPLAAAAFAPVALVMFLTGQLITPPQGAKTSIYLASTKQVPDGMYFDKCAPVPYNRLADDAGLRGALWDVSEELCGL